MPPFKRSHEKLAQTFIHTGALRHCSRHRIGHRCARVCGADETVGRRLYQADQMVIGPVVFCTVVSGIAGMQNMKQVGRVSGKALLYFETISTLALLIGLGAAHLLKPGASFNVDPSTLDANIVSS